MEDGKTRQAQEYPVDVEPSEQEVENARHQRASVGLPPVEEQEPEEQDDDYPYGRNV